MPRSSSGALGCRQRLSRSGLATRMCGSRPKLRTTMLESFTENLAIARETGEMTIIDVTCHAHIFGHPRGAHYYGKIVEAAAAAADVWIGTRAQIASHVLAREAS